MSKIKFKYYLQQEDTGYITSIFYTLEEIESSYNGRSFKEYFRETFPRYFVFARAEYTGLKDKDDTEIYEGDIIDYRSANYYCEFINGGFCFRHGKKNILNLYPEDTNYGNEVEVIGNIYENPELKKEQTK